MYEIGKTEVGPTSNGLKFLMHPKHFKIYSNRLIKMEVNLQGNYSVTVTNAYAPASSPEDYYRRFQCKNLKLKQKKKTTKAWEHLE